MNYEYVHAVYQKRKYIGKFRETPYYNKKKSPPSFIISPYLSELKGSWHSLYTDEGPSSKGM